MKWKTIHITAFKSVRRDCTDTNLYMYVLKQLTTSLVPRSAHVLFLACDDNNTWKGKSREKQGRPEVLVREKE